MHIEISDYITFLNDKHDLVKRAKETKIKDLYDIYPHLKKPFPYQMPFKDNQHEIMDFEDLVYNANDSSGLPQTTETRELLLGLSDILRLKYVTINKRTGRIILGALDKTNGNEQKIVLDPIDLGYDFEFDIAVGFSTTSIKVEIARERYMYVYERIGLYNAQEELIWKNCF